MKIKRVIRWLLVIIWLCLTIYLSQQAGTESATTSGWLARQIMRIMRFFGINVHYSLLHAFLRKFAHFCVHFVLAWLTYRALFVSYKVRMNAIVGCFLICCTVAIFDEAIQNVSPGRAAMIFDALLNLFGVATGALIGIFTEKTTK